MSGRLTTHALDLAAGRPAAGMRVDLYRWAQPLDGIERRERLGSFELDADGRSPGPLLEGEAFAAGVYELVFHVAAYHRSAGARLVDPPFLDEVPVRFGVADAREHHHVPLLLSPYGYSTYRGS